MLSVCPGRARWRARLGAIALACASPLLAMPGGAAAAQAPIAEPLDWRQANEAVGRFLRGHLDLIKTEPDNAVAAPPRDDVLTLAQAQSMALARRPELFDRPGLAPSERLAQRRDALALRLRVQTLWSNAVLADRLAVLADASADAARTGAELGRRMAQVGNWSQAQWHQEQAVALEAQLARDQARQQAQAALEALVRELALADAQVRPHLPQTLPAAPDLQASGGEPDLPKLQAQAAQNHPAVALARLEAQRQRRGATQEQLMAARQQLLASAQHATQQGMPVATVNPVALAWPAELERALEADLRAEAQAASLQSQVREAWQALLTSRALATQLNQLLALHTEQLADMQRRYNGMLKSTWDLLGSARQRLAVEQRLLQAQHRQWLAQATLHHLLAGGEPDTTSTPSDTPATDARRSPDH